jgi:hypothetical protein
MGQCGVPPQIYWFTDTKNLRSEQPHLRSQPKIWGGPKDGNQLENLGGAVRMSGQRATLSIKSITRTARHSQRRPRHQHHQKCVQESGGEPVETVTGAEVRFAICKIINLPRVGTA